MMINVSHLTCVSCRCEKLLTDPTEPSAGNTRPAHTPQTLNNTNISINQSINESINEQQLDRKQQACSQCYLQDFLVGGAGGGVVLNGSDGVLKN